MPTRLCQLLSTLPFCLSGVFFFCPRLSILQILQLSLSSEERLALEVSRQLVERPYFA